MLRSTSLGAAGCAGSGISEAQGMLLALFPHLGTSYKEQANTSEVVQVSVEGVDQLETYFGQYLPQFFYAMLAPMTRFIILSFVNFPSAIVLLVCVPLIPVTIVIVQRWVKRLLAKYWGQYKHWMTLSFFLRSPNGRQTKNGRFLRVKKLETHPVF